MSVEDINKIDLITMTQEDIVSQQVILVITDHLQWSSCINEHLFKLQEKINRYIAFVESGEIYEKLPDAQGRNITFKVFFQYKIPQECIDFMERVNEILSSINIELTYEESEVI
ncbi:MULTISPECIES: DUF6572 domain-containing protein [Photorhabdus]|uniref:Uncharacterized protein n=1 Tax=Photorhabdus khanii NC19 TaxID=1004151 RepID=W3VAA0_9GAMM|nr:MULTISPECIES: DUF6572 domain-containing protein [Photorhabdus]ETS32866.1 hypothetical protein PTE_00004 [Photorhabdus khanii NC19]OHV53724.1 hypothetical protein BB987_11635 [Photorhabdus temperata]OHV55860.1 hypothetical protein BB987_06560 [Photorhabdus temperata]